MCNATVWNEENLTILFQLAKAYLDKPIMREYSTEAYFRTHGKYDSFLKQALKVVRQTSKLDTLPSGKPAINAQMQAAMSTKDLNVSFEQAASIREVVRNRRIAVKVGYMPEDVALLLDSKNFSTTRSDEDE